MSVDVRIKFKDRAEAAEELAYRLIRYKNLQNGIVLAIPRGGVPIGFIIAKALGLPLQAILIKKIGHPLNPEFAIGAASLTEKLINPDTNVSEEYINSTTKRIQKILKERYKSYSGGKEPSSLEEKIVIIVDDGIATGYTMEATIKLVKKSHPQKIIIAVPVAPPDIFEKLKEEVNEIVCLKIPEDFLSVGQFYENFYQVNDAEVNRYLKG